MQQLAIKHSEQNSKVKTKLIAAVIKKIHENTANIRYEQLDTAMTDIGYKLAGLLLLFLPFCLLCVYFGMEFLLFFSFSFP